MNEIDFLNIPLVEWIGYLASTVVLISLSLASVIRLRIFNLLGAALFSFYGFYIGSLPVGIMNFIIVLVNIYYLQKLISISDAFQVIKADTNQEIVESFIDHYLSDIRTFFPEFKLEHSHNKQVLLIMRNMNIAGIFIAKQENQSWNIELDYVTPQYRDYKNGSFLFEHFKRTLSANNIHKLVAVSTVPQQIHYLKKVGFTEDNTLNNTYIWKT